MNPTRPYSYADITEPLPEALESPADYSSPMTDWKQHGVYYLKDFIPRSLLDAYSALWLCENAGKPNGWGAGTPYMTRPAIRALALYPPLMGVMNSLMMESMGMHLNLTGWVSTQRNWHADSYLNPPFVGSRYVAIWIALDDISSSSGPFQYVPGSHRWPVIRREKLLSYYDTGLVNNPDWPWLTQSEVSQVCEDEIAKRGARVETYLPKRGDVLFWHSSLLHRGSAPHDPTAQRRAFIAHFSALSVRHDMPNRAQEYPDCHYFCFPPEEK